MVSRSSRDLKLAQTVEREENASSSSDNLEGIPKTLSVQSGDHARPRSTRSNNADNKTYKCTSITYRYTNVSAQDLEDINVLNMAADDMDTAPGL
ncbi:hypothetical protein PoB_004765600 [Plakobranchus ocellatus]|uniref:Uncharacterized protein n=1 Tax=Plakobranchus ocellatus TaxID=259542 RepID=A0AAV4BQ33_9GAST|nr:hypothetical protein PoB_004765600 [Plakobranchus ocellatus]